MRARRVRGRVSVGRRGLGREGCGWKRARGGVRAKV
jgi:hypothetical protein